MANWIDSTLMNVLTRSWDENTIKGYPDRVRKYQEAIPPMIADLFQVFTIVVFAMLPTMYIW
jgi:hypothetical protein